MKACRFACVLALGAALALGTALQACTDLPKADTRPVTGLPPEAGAPPEVVGIHAADPDLVDAQFVQGQTRISAPPCSYVYIAVAEGKVTTPKDVLERGDVMIVKFPDAMYVNVDGLALRVTQPFACQMLSKPGAELSVRKAAVGRELSWANGQMHAHLDVGKDVSPDLYLGRLEGTAGVPEHRHPTSVEILAAVEASGTFTMNGAEKRIGPRTIVTVPKDTPHSWRPDTGSKLVAIQLYVPPGPEQRFLQLDADDKDAGAAKTGRLPDGGFAQCEPPWVLDPHGRHRYKPECLVNGSQKPSDVPPEQWDPYTKTDMRGDPKAAPHVTPARPSDCPIEQWDMFNSRCIKKR